MRTVLTHDEIFRAVAWFMGARGPFVTDEITILVDPHDDGTFDLEAVVEFHEELPPPGQARPQRRDRAGAPGVVYFVGGIDAGPVKVGFTAGKVADRVAALQTGSPVLLGVLGVVRGRQGLETVLHRELADHRLHGEWFERSAALAVLARRS